MLTGQVVDGFEIVRELWDPADIGASPVLPIISIECEKDEEVLSFIFDFSNPMQTGMLSHVMHWMALSSASQGPLSQQIIYINYVLKALELTLENLTNEQKVEAMSPIGYSVPFIRSLAPLPSEVQSR